MNKDIEEEKLGFMKRRTDAIQSTFINFSDGVIKARPFHRATTFGLALMVGGVLSSVLTSLIPKFNFSEGMSIAMLLLGGILFLVGIIGDVWLKKSLAEKLLASGTLSVEAVDRQQALVDELVSGPPSTRQINTGQ